MKKAEAKFMRTSKTNTYCYFRRKQTDRRKNRCLLTFCSGSFRKKQTLNKLRRLATT